MEINRQKQIPAQAFESVICNECGGKHFTQSFAIKFYKGGLYSAEPIFMPIAEFYCVQCGEFVDGAKLKFEKKS